jgi:putative sterol carrier protein
MPLLPFTQPWADAFRDAINGDAGYRAAGAGWAWPLALVLEPVAEYGYPAGGAVQLELSRGQCDGARAVEPAAVTAPYALRGDYAAWKSIVRGELDPVTAVMTRRLTLASGSLTTLMMHTRSAKALVECARHVDTAFPDEER